MSRPISVREPRSKVLNREQLIQRFGRPRTERVVFTNGCFDILHRGHVEYLSAARALGDALVIGLNTDASVRRLKGEGRPVNQEEDRALVLAALEAVDAVVHFDEDTPLELITALLPDVLVKGGDYTIDTIVGAREVVAAGGEVVVAPLLAGRSTTSILKRAREGSEHG
jgi:rfaE bifunctional protein nucleotidyltransferase chain/domain